jgi:diadenylate cyclase
MSIKRPLIEAALVLAKGSKSKVIAFLDEIPEDELQEHPELSKFTIVLVAPTFDIKGRRIFRISIPRNLNIESTLNLISAFLIEQGLLHEGDSYVYLTPEIVGRRAVKKNLFAMNGFFSQSQSVVQRLIEIAIELSVEGREGRPIGTLFVVGDVKNVLKHSHSMLPNPFRGHKINVLDRESKEIIKEFAQLDGAFIISSRGRIVSAGVYLEVDPKGLNLMLPPGLGSRHIAAAGITKLTKATSISLSESGTIRVFKNGIMLLEYNPRMKY